MRSSAFLASVEKSDEIFIYKDDNLKGEHRLKIGPVNLHRVTNSQLLDLGMKIQSVVNAIDRENRVKEERHDCGIHPIVPLDKP